MREEKAVYTSINSQNIHSIFTYSQLVISGQATALISPFLQAATIVDLNGLYNNIWSVITQDETLQEYLCHLIEH